MKRWTHAVLLAAAAASACSGASPRAELPAGTPAVPPFVRVGMTQGGRIVARSVPLEEYVQAAILSEFDPAAGDADTIERMLEVQAVVARTYVIAHLGRHTRDGYDVCDTTHCQLFQPARLQTSRWAGQAAEAVRSTRSEVLWFDGAPALTVFHSDCGGRTSSAADVWGGTVRPYLVSRADDGPASDAHASWRYDVSSGALRNALNADPRTRVGARLDGLQVLDRDAAGRAEQVAIHGAEPRIVRGEALREVLTAAFGPRSIRSTWFEVQNGHAQTAFEGRGFGHGVGLCQAGALARVRSGATVASVLQRYFPGTSLLTLR
jgi:stage II sporulation protein D (peptidoglycan lytic transglycosylase)